MRGRLVGQSACQIDSLFACQLSLKESGKEFEEEAKYLLALKLYEIGKISSGKAAKLW